MEWIKYSLVYTADLIRKFDSKSNRAADSIRDSIRTQKNDSQVPTSCMCDCPFVYMWICLHVCVCVAVSVSTCLCLSVCRCVEWTEASASTNAGVPQRWHRPRRVRCSSQVPRLVAFCHLTQRQSNCPLCRGLFSVIFAFAQTVLCIHRRPWTLNVNVLLIHSLLDIGLGFGVVSLLSSSWAFFACVISV